MFFQVGLFGRVVTLTSNIRKESDVSRPEPKGMHHYQVAVLELSKVRNINKMSLREIGKEVGIGHPQQVQHHLDALRDRGLL